METTKRFPYLCMMVHNPMLKQYEELSHQMLTNDEYIEMRLNGFMLVAFTLSNVQTLAYNSTFVDEPSVVLIDKLVKSVESLDSKLTDDGVFVKHQLIMDKAPISDLYY